MREIYAELNDIFLKTKENIEKFNAMLRPVIENAQDERERLYFHHIEEEEEQRLERLNILLPMLEQAKEGEMNLTQFILLLEELNLEKFGLHNFREHLDLALFEFKDEPRQTQLLAMRERTESDYEKVKQYLSELNEQFQNLSSPETRMDTLFSGKTIVRSPAIRKQFTVGSLRNDRQGG